MDNPTSNIPKPPLWPRADDPPYTGKRINWLVPLAVGISIGIALSFLEKPQESFFSFQALREWVQELVPPPLSVMVEVLILYMFYRVYGFLITSIHELGHVIGGALVGFQTIIVQVFPLRLWRYAGRWKLSWQRASSAPLLNFASSLPRTERDLPERWLVMLLGGPLANLFLVALIGLFARIAPEPLRSSALPFLTPLGIFSLIIGVYNLYPIRPSSDGWRALELLRGGMPAERQVAALTLGAQQLAGLPPQQWDEQKLRYLLEHPQGDASDLSDQYSSFRRHALLYQDTAAERDLEKLFTSLERVPPAARGLYWVEAAHFNASVRRDPVSARAALEHIPVRQRAALKPAIDSVHVYLLHLEGKFEQAETLAQSVFARLKASHPAVAQHWYDEFTKRGRKSSGESQTVQA